MTFSISELKRLAAERSKAPWRYTAAYGAATIECGDYSAIAHAVEYLQTSDADFISYCGTHIDEIIARMDKIDSLFAVIKHGDADHQAWLLQAIKDHFK